MKIYTILFIIVLSIFGCASKEVKPTVIEKETQKTTNIEEKTEKKAILNTQNITQEDAYNRVFRNCFATGKVHLQKSCKKKIDKFLSETSLKDKRNIFIEVHTDKSGSSKNNLNISKKRANITAGSLFYKEYKYSQVYYQGYGESKLLYDEETKLANIQNRRVVIKLRPKNFKAKKGEYRLFKKIKKSINRPKVPKKKVNKKKKRLDILSFTGEADTGWIYFGKASLAKKFSISCEQDSPLKVQHKAISKAKKDEFMSELYNARIKGSFAGKNLEVYPIYLYEDGKLPIGNPILTLDEGKGNIVRLQTTVNTYRGKKGILYRIFVNGKKKIKCVDLVISYDSNKISYGKVYTKEEKSFRFKPE